MATYTYYKYQVEKHENILLEMLRERDLMVSGSEKFFQLEEKIEKRKADLQGKWDRLKKSEVDVSLVIIRMVDELLRLENAVGDEFISKVAEASLKSRNTFYGPYEHLKGSCEEEVEYLRQIEKLERKLNYELDGSSISEYYEELSGFSTGSVVVVLKVVKGLGL